LRIVSVMRPIDGSGKIVNTCSQSPVLTKKCSLTFYPNYSIVPSIMQESNLPKLTTSFATLTKQVAAEIEAGRINIKAAASYEKTISYWKIGRLIAGHIQSVGDGKPNYGEYVFAHLSTDLGIGKRSLYFAVQFFRTYPDVDETARLISWSHYRLLLTVKDDRRRREYERILVDKRMSVQEFAALVRGGRGLINSPGSEIPVQPGTFGLYRVKTVGDHTLLDLGFHCYSDVAGDTLDDYLDGQLIQVTRPRKNPVFSPVGSDPAGLYTYRALVKKVVDGDTLSVHVELGLGVWRTEILRLRDINAPELTSEAGKRAASVIESALKDCRYIVIKTYRRDMYARYVADVRYLPGSEDGAEIMEQGRFLNQELLDAGLVSRYYMY
jgi:endonuclease YncB( thermonuclease family)